MPKPLGHSRWAIPEGMIPSDSTGPAPIVVQHTRLSSRQPELGIMTTVAFAGAE